MKLNQLLEEYKESDNKDEIFKIFTTRLWSSKYRFAKYTKAHTYKIDDKLSNDQKEILELFEKYKRVEYIVCRSFYKKRLEPIDYIRIHINNMFGYLVDKDVYYHKKFYKLLQTPKNEYFKALREIKLGNKVDCKNIEQTISSSLVEAEEIKNKSSLKKIELSWQQYRKLIDTYLRRIFDNYIPIHEYEEKHGWNLDVSIDGWSEDNYAVKYFCRSLTGYMRNYIRNNNPKEFSNIKECLKCKKEIKILSNNHKYCDDCWKVRQRELWRTNKRKYRNVQV